MVTIPTISVVFLVHGAIQYKIVQWLAGFICTGDVEVNLSLLSKAPPLTDKAVDLRCSSLAQGDGRLSQVVWGEVFPFTGRVFKPIQLSLHNLAGAFNRGVTIAASMCLLGAMR